MRRLAIILGFSGFLFSCNTKKMVYDKPYFDIDSLLQKQIHLLVSATSKVGKKTTLNGKTDSTLFVPDSTQWKYELDAFWQLDAINKPSYKDAFEQKEEDDQFSNLRVRAFTAKVKSPVPEIRFYFQGNSKLKKIQALYEEENLMMRTSRKLTLEFDQNQGNETLSHYTVEGQQKMIFNNPVIYSIIATVTPSN